MSANPADWNSFAQLIQDLVSGSVRRNQFTQWELDLLLDIQTSRLRKSSRVDALRRYQRAVLAAQTDGAEAPPRFSAFLLEVAARRAAASAGTSE